MARVHLLGEDRVCSGAVTTKRFRQHVFSFLSVQPAVREKEFLSRFNVRRGVDPHLPIDKLRRAIPKQRIEAVIKVSHVHAPASLASIATSPKTNT